MEEMFKFCVRYVLGIEVCKNFEYFKEIFKYGLGIVRSLKEYQIFVGLYFKISIIESCCKFGKFQ